MKVIVCVCAFLLMVFFVDAQSDTTKRIVAPPTTVLVPSISASDNEFEGETPDVPAILDFYEGLLGILFMLWGFIAKAFKLNKRFPNFVFVVLAGGITLAGIFIYFGLTEGLGAAFTIISTMGLFDIIKGGTKQLTEELKETKEES